jgi:DNA-binding GntR family transcriptional regulator
VADRTPEEADAPAFDSRTLRERVLDRLREDILSSELPPGTELSEVTLAESFGVSRGPIREAMGQLASEGLLTVTPRRGAVVTALTREEFLDAYQVREALETLAIRLAVPRLEERDIARLRRLHESMLEEARRGEVGEFFATNAEFHQLFVSASGNRKLEEMHGRLLRQMGRYLARSLELRGTLERSAAEHSAILETVEAGDAERAARLLADHIEVPQREIASDLGEELFHSKEQPTSTATEGSQS